MPAKLDAAPMLVKTCSGAGLTPPRSSGIIRLPVFRDSSVTQPNQPDLAPLGADVFRRPALPNVKSAEKRMRTNEIRAARNRAFRSKLRTALKKVRTAGNAGEGASALREAASLLDRAARKRIVHPNKAARAKSRLSAFVGKLAA